MCFPVSFFVQLINKSSQNPLKTSKQLNALGLLYSELMFYSDSERGKRHTCFMDGYAIPLCSHNISFKLKLEFSKYEEDKPAKGLFLCCICSISYCQRLTSIPLPNFLLKNNRTKTI